MKGQGIFADVPQERRLLMGCVKRANTKPELAIRSLLHAMGYRFRLDRGDLPGRPDIVLPRHRIAIFVHGCFWHRHPGCRGATTPKVRAEYWTAKFDANVMRDRTAEAKLYGAGWKVFVIWECETKDADKLATTLADRLEKMKNLGCSCR